MNCPDNDNKIKQTSRKIRAAQKVLALIVPLSKLHKHDKHVRYKEVLNQNGLAILFCILAGYDSK